MCWRGREYRSLLRTPRALERVERALPNNNDDWVSFRYTDVALEYYTAVLSS